MGALGAAEAEAIASVEGLTGPDVDKLVTVNHVDERVIAQFTLDWDLQLNCHNHGFREYRSQPFQNIFSLLCPSLVMTTILLQAALQACLPS